MKKTIKKLLAAVIACGALMLAGCSGYESWAYIYEPDKEAFRMYKNGKAVLDGTDYTYIKDEQYITLKDKDGVETKMRYEMDKDQMLIYKRAVYQYAGEEEQNGLIGTWKAENGWSYEFTDNGTFREDAYFPGYYMVDEENSRIKLAYNDHFYDTYIYYSLDGDKLTVDDPWPMMKTQKESAPSGEKK